MVCYKICIGWLLVSKTITSHSAVSLKSASAYVQLIISYAIFVIAYLAWKINDVGYLSI